MSNITHRNHYVSQAFLRRWSEEGVNVWGYEILVPHANVPLWRRRAISGIGYHNDLYTSSEAGREIDDFEHWINKEYEQPAFDPIGKLVAGRRVSASDWHRIARFVAAQDLRTPVNFLEFKNLYDEHAPKILDQLVEEFVRFRNAGLPLIESAPPPPGFAEALRVRVVPTLGPKPRQLEAQVEVASRKLWLASQRHALSNCAAVLCDYRWSVATPHSNEEWPLTDHPVLRLNWYKPGQYDFGGGWGNKGTEIMMPISPRQLLYLKVGTKSESRFMFSQEHTRLVQRLLAERAHRWIFARNPEPWVAEVRPRAVDEVLFLAEQNAWSRWRGEQLQAEAQIATNGPR